MKTPIEELVEAVEQELNFEKDLNRRLRNKQKAEKRLFDTKKTNKSKTNKRLRNKKRKANRNLSSSAPAV